MGNLCAIFHIRFKQLLSVIPLARQAQLMDYLLLGWQTSTYTLKNSSYKWFMKPYAIISAETGIPISSLERYIKSFSDAGFIERRQALFSRTKGQNEFEVRKGNYIYITEKLLALISSSKSTAAPISKHVTDIPDYHKKLHEQALLEKASINPACKIIDNFEGTDPLILRGLYISNLYSFNNNITFKKLTASVDKELLRSLTQQFKTVQQLLYSEIKEEIPEEVKQLVVGTFFNLTFKNKARFSSPKQLAAEYLFALLNRDFYLPKVQCFKHRNNIFAKMIRKHLWRTPKGFYKHFYLGSNFRDHKELQELNWQRLKQQEIINANEKVAFVLQGNCNTKTLVSEKQALLTEVMQKIYETDNEELISGYQTHVQDLRAEIKTLEGELTKEFQLTHSNQKSLDLEHSQITPLEALASQVEETVATINQLTLSMNKTHDKAIKADCLTKIGLAQKNLTMLWGACDKLAEDEEKNNSLAYKVEQCA